MGPEHTSLDQLVRALRNAVAHFNVEFKPGPDREITSVRMWNQKLDKNGKPIPESRRWEVLIEVEELDRLARHIARLYLETFASTAA